MEAFPDSERRQERRFNRKGVVMNIHRDLLLEVYVYVRCYIIFLTTTKTAKEVHQRKLPPISIVVSSKKIATRRTRRTQVQYNRHFIHTSSSAVKMWSLKTNNISKEV